MIKAKDILRHETSLLLLAFLFLILAHGLFSSFSTIEDSQQILFPVIVLFVFTFFKIKNVKLPTFVFIFVLVAWVLFLFRIEIMDFSKFFSGRVIVGRLKDDPDGLESRKLYKSLQKIAYTYHLPGPSLLPITEDDRIVKSNYFLGLGSYLDRTKINKSVPALEIYGTKNQYNLIFNESLRPNLKNCVDNPKVFLCEDQLNKNRIFFIPSPNSERENLVLPSYPPSLKVGNKSKYMIGHYIEWLAAYFSPEISNKQEVRFDVLFEAASLQGLEVQSVERIFLKILLSYEELVYYLLDGSIYHLTSSRNRLNEILYLVKKIKNPELHGFAYNLYALSLIYSPENSGSLESSIRTLKYIAESKDISLFQRNIASYNLSLLESF